MQWRAEEDEYESRKKSKVKKKNKAVRCTKYQMKSTGRKDKNYVNFKSSKKGHWGENLFLNYK